jgi:acyl-CoA reductase-like NAD-dependent aldehyde dehydrogenase
MLAVHQPGTGETIAAVAWTSVPELEAALERAAALHRRRATEGVPLHERIAILRRLGARLTEERDSLAHTIALEGGKPRWDADVEVTRAIDSVDLAIRELQHLTGDAVPMGITAASAGRVTMSWRDPIGVCLAISAFNHPLNLAVHQVIPAVAVGAPILFKPSLRTPLSGLRLLALLQECGLPEGWATPILISDEQVGALVADPRIAHVSFIGSATVGWMLRSRAAAGTRVSLEHGGVAPCLVDAGVDVGPHMNALLKGCFYHAGQVCISTQRLFVVGDRARAVADQLAQAAEGLKMGQAPDPTTEIGPLIRPEAVQRVHQWVDEAVSAGAERVTGGHTPGDWFYAPTVLYDAPPEVRISREEVFGPVVTVYPVADLDEAIARANAVPWAFSASILTDRIAPMLQAARGLNASTVLVNDHTAFRTDWMPFGGRGPSGLGEGGIGYTMRDLTQNRMVVIRG